MSRASAPAADPRAWAGARPRAEDVLARLREFARPERLEGMAQYGIATDRALGVTVTELRPLARTLGRDHRLALALWRFGLHEARILATIVDEPDLVTETQMESWARDLDSWDLCDQACANLFDRTPFAVAKAVEWSAREEELIRRAGFALIAGIAVHRRDVGDAELERLLPLIESRATDDRTYVKKAVNWALRQIGKRSRRLNRAAIGSARRIARLDARSARWIAADALRELQGDAVRARLERRSAGAAGRRTG